MVPISSPPSGAASTSSPGWPQTKAKAKAKLAVLKVGVGYPDKWIDYPARNRRGGRTRQRPRAALFETHRNLAKLGKPVDRSEWVMTANRQRGESPGDERDELPGRDPPTAVFRLEASGGHGLRAAGAMIGHEISHSFDDQGAQFDATGKLHNWWTPEDFAHFKEASRRSGKQYDLYRPFPDLALNGQQVLSENIADLAGLSITYDAWKLSLDGKARRRSTASRAISSSS